MSSLVLTAAGHIGSTLVSTAKRTALSFANRAISNAFDTRNFEGPRLDSFHVQTSRDGAPMPRIYGRVRIAGQVIWASKLTEYAKTESAGGKGGGPTQTNYSYSISFAIGLCEGEILSVDRIWANGAVLNTQGLSYRVHKGTADQMPDPIISATEGGTVPAFRNTSYIVFEGFPLGDFGNRLPQINVELMRVPKEANTGERLETLVTGVNLLPSSGEFAYSPSVKEQIVGPGTSKPLNMNNSSGVSDFSKAIDQLENEFPECKSVSIIISWFGSDLRCGMCKIRPGVDHNDREMVGDNWSVGPDDQASAYLISQDGEGRSNFGGTPSDQSILEAISDLKSRGYSVTLYPFILMDIPSDNNLPNPYNGAGSQSVFPWRGRITASTAPDQTGSPDMTPSILPEIDNFFGVCMPSDFGVTDAQITYSGPSGEYGFRRFIMHYAKLAAHSQGVDRFVIGSEMRGVTTLRSGVGAYPSVAHLVTLAADVKSIVGTSVALTYAADWTEYYGHHVKDASGNSGGDVTFHLDPLWASPAISAVGIDAYFPLSDWRDGDNHLDAPLAQNIYDLNYLKSQMEGGEGYDYFYSSASDRAAQNRTPITDGAVQKPWVFRYKDLRNWWGNAHYNRVNGVESAVSTGWVPQSKPFWLTEIGCPAIDKGANQPNVFVDPKSSESVAPYFSNGGRDDLIQRRYVEAFISYWSASAGHNPISTVYFGPMIDMSGIHVWCWDARPFPEFPSLESVWSDGANWELGHWLTGRTGLIPLADVVEDAVRQAGVTELDTSKVNGTLQGYVIDRPMSTRAVLEPLAMVYGFNMIETAQGLRFISVGAEDVVNLNVQPLAGDSLNTIEYTKDDQTLRLKDVRLHFIDPTNSYQLGSVSARDKSAETIRVMDINAPLVLGKTYAKYVCDQILDRAQASSQSLVLDMPLNALSIEVGDIIQLSGDTAEWRVEGLEFGSVQSVKARLETGRFTPTVSAARPPNVMPPIWIADPVVHVLDIPRNKSTSGPLIGVELSPFSTVQIEPKFGYGLPDIRLDNPANLGRLTASLLRGPTARWDRVQTFTARFENTSLSSVTEFDLLNGTNRFAVETERGWEVLQAQNIDLVSAGTYQFSMLLRGLWGSSVEMVDTVPAGARIVSLKSSLGVLDIPNDLIGASLDIKTQTARRPAKSHAFDYEAKHLRPMPPVQGRCVLKGSNKQVTWIRQSRMGGDNWAALEIPLGETREFYRVELLQGQTVLDMFETLESNITFTPAQFQNAEYVSIAQGSDIYGFGPALEIPL